MFSREISTCLSRQPRRQPGNHKAQVEVRNVKTTAEAPRAQIVAPSCRQPRFLITGIYAGSSGLENPR
jgi:hypothetical protein